MFKKWTALLSAALFFFCFYSLYAAKTPVFSAYSDEFEIYFTAGSFGDSVFCTAREYPFITKIKGESCSVNVSYGKVLSDFGARHVFSEKTDAGDSFYAFSPAIAYSVTIGENRVNIHYFLSESGVKKLGTPLIFGGY